MKAIINIEVVVNKVGIINTPNHLMKRQFSMLITQTHNEPHRLALSHLSKVVVMLKLGL
jgi:hypothetical protein